MVQWAKLSNVELACIPHEYVTLGSLLSSRALFKLEDIDLTLAYDDLDLNERYK